ncbi:type IX secretion system sortase PorU [Wenyingzhuangia sp. IMCC45574]
MRFISFFAFFFTTISVFCQKKTFIIDMSLVSQKSIQEKVFNGNDIYLRENFIPLFFKQWVKEETGSISDYTISNVKEETMSSSTLGSVEVNKLPNGLTYNLRAVKESKKEFYSFELSPLYKKESGEIVKVTSFDLSYKVTKQKKAFVTSGSDDVVTNSVLSSGKWYKFAVDKTGVYKLNVSFLASLGINTSNLDPQKIRIFGNGGNMLPELLSIERSQDLEENAIYVSGSNDGRFTNNDYILFYAQGPLTWQLNSRENITHRQNIYSNYSYYFINVDSGENGKRVENMEPVNLATTKAVTTYTDYKLHEKELTNYIRTGRKWYGEDFSVESVRTFDFDFKNIDISTPVISNVNFSASSTGVTNYSLVYDNQDGVDGTNVELFKNQISKISSDFVFRERNGIKSFNTERNNDLRFHLNWDNSGDLSAKGYLDYIRVVADCFLIADTRQFGFVNFDSNTTGEVLEYKIQNKSNIDFVWDVTDFKNPKSLNDINLSDSDFSFKEITDGVLQKYHLVKESDALEPINLGAETVVENQNLHALKDVQYLIVTQASFISQAERLANYHRENTKIDGEPINVKVVDLAKIYLEFGSGSPDITAIRDFAKFLYDTGSTDAKRLKYLCLFGDASFDYKGITYRDGNIVPVYLSNKSNNLITSYNSDDYYAFLDETDDVVDNQELSLSGRMEITTGRIPVRTPTVAKQYVDKLLNYYSSNSFGKWKTRITFFGDDGQYGEHQSLIRYLEESALKIEVNNKNVNLSKLYTDAFKEDITSGGGAYPDLVKRFEEAFNNGSGVINYFGHGGTSSLGEENFLDLQTIRSYRNLNNLPIFITVTCDFSRFDDPSFLSAGEELIESKFGGAVSMITTTRRVFILSGRTINNKLADFMYEFDGNQRTVAEALKDVKNDISTEGELFVYFFGDPLMKLPVPEDGIEIENVFKITKNEETEEDILTRVTELNGLSKIRVTGKIVEKDSVLIDGKYVRPVLSDFNGNLSVTLFDKEIERTTLLNEVVASGGTVRESDKVKFKSLENKVFVGDATVDNGLFTFDFILPKDVNPISGNAKFSFYASSKNREKAGSNFDYKVGGLDADAKEDNTPPVINLFMDNESFVDGGGTGITPTLIAKVEDESGINTSLNSFGHTISLVIDGDLTNPITLNEYYQTEKDDFTKGIITYEMPALPEGDHTITLKVWDSHNNSSIQTLNFFVQADLKFKIDKVLNYPNPFINHTEFWFENNRKNEPLEIKVQVYTLSGKLVRTLRGASLNTSQIIKAVTWDGRDDYGNKLGKGVYLYKVVVKEIISGQSDEKIEKLVLL